MIRSTNHDPNVAIVGASGAVGQEFLSVLAQRHFPIEKLTLLASARSSGQTVQFRDQTHTIAELTEESFKDVDLALFSAGGAISKQYAPIASASGATVVDNSSAFRMTEGVPLVIPEINPQAVEGINLGQGGIIANPNCSTIILLVPVTPLHRAATVRRMVVSTYQAASGAGAAAMAELEQQTRQVLAGQPPTCEIFSQQYAFNLFSHNSEISPDGYNTEEVKMMRETHKIWDQTGQARVAMTATCVRVPVMRAHAESVHLTLDRPMEIREARQLLQDAPGISIIDDPVNNRFPTPLDASGQDDIFVGRLRPDISIDSEPGCGLNLFVCGDQLRKGAALKRRANCGVVALAPTYFVIATNEL